VAESDPERAAEGAAQQQESAGAAAAHDPNRAPPRPAGPLAEESVRELLVSATQDVYLSPDPPTADAATHLNPARIAREWLRRGAEFVSETRFARRQSRELLALYQRVLIDEPQLAGTALYAKVISLRLRGDAQYTRSVLLRAEQSFCEWPAERALRFRDVVSYIVVSEYLRDHRASPGTQSNMVNVVARTVPETC
jgi:hypothetical protein